MIKPTLKSVLVGLVFALTTIVFSSVPKPALAAYDGGNLIDEITLLNSSAMNAADIQSFLVSKGSGLASRSFLFDCASTADSAQYYQNAGAPCGQTVLASRIIYYASQIYGINPQAVLTIMQKEQSLVTTANPTSWQINQAMGYGCPTSTGCVASNFLYQVDNGVWVLRLNTERARGNMTWWFTSSSWVCGIPKNFYKPNLYPNQNVNFYDEDNVYYRTHYIANAATSAFYCYTPHAYNNPNGLYGLPKYGTTGRYYTGSYNFVTYFERWFGSTKGTPFFQFPGSVATYVLGAGNTYYSIRDYERLKDYGFETTFNLRVSVVDRASVAGSVYKGDLPPIARFEGIGVFIINSGQRYPFPSEALFQEYGYSFGQEATLPSWVGNYLNTGASVQQIVRPSDGYAVYYVKAGKKQAFCHDQAFSTLGTPTYSSRPYVTLRSFYTNTIPDGPPIANEGDIIVSRDTGEFGIWQNSAYSPINGTVAANTGAVNCAVSNTAAKQLPVGPVVNNLVKDSHNNAYILDKNKKISINTTDLIALGKASTDFISVSDTLLNKIPSTPMNTTVRVDGGAGVFVIRTGKKYGIPSEADLYGLGLSFAQVQNITKDTYNITSYGGTIYKPGRVVRINNGPGVYMLEDGFKKHAFTSEGTFLGYGYKWSDVVNIGASQIQAYTDSGYVSKYSKDIYGNYWLVDNNTRRLISSTLSEPLYYGVNSANSTPISNNVLNQTPWTANLGKVFRSGADKGVYLIENGTKRAFTSEAALLTRGHKWTDVQSLSSEYVSSLPTGSPIY